MAVTINTAAFSGIEGVLVSVEVDLERGLPCFSIVGLPDTSVKESKERVRAAIVNSGFEFPIKRIVINLAPADIKKVGALFDLPIALGILMATEQITFEDAKNFLIMGELSLSGKLKRVRGVLPIAIESINEGINNFILPMENAEECSVVKNTRVYAFESLKQVIEYIKYRDLMPYEYINNPESSRSSLDFEDILGQESCKRAIEVAAAGNHNVAMFGPPGSGKTMIAQRVSTILPTLSYEEGLEVTKIYSVSGNLEKYKGFINQRPFRSPHHTITTIGLVGGGNNLMPGEVSLAHNGVLFLDEILEFKRNALEVLRQPLEDRKVTICRGSGKVTYPCNIMAVISTNPCPCGYYGSAKQCSCGEFERRRYMKKLSGPLLDRIDLFCFVNPLSYDEIKAKAKGESSKEIRVRVEKARELQKNRFKEENIYCNAQMDGKLIRKYCKLNSKSNNILEKIYNRYTLSTRAYSRILKVARTIADLYEREDIVESDIIEALQYRRFLNQEII
ncbi:YifB family Mg chelatase-like AAA ATPase [Clostridium sp. CX1]|uniref:YifB family Mg chelatase-like AAA ATPase n=1 Tax=Clostridium sp. CX1 TaxID=2978346 RepID=UPI0021BF2990|nr:YifB family Mg chelatase-like AAA ATPase [Clostridium sp. CX1]MCT8976836.1 YifB family Mg chelatase-like AAA ATPase [Clostridium sp. CX1]